MTNTVTGATQPGEGTQPEPSSNAEGTAPVQPDAKFTDADFKRFREGAKRDQQKAVDKAVGQLVSKLSVAAGLEDVDDIEALAEQIIAKPKAEQNVSESDAKWQRKLEKSERRAAALEKEMAERQAKERAAKISSSIAKAGVAANCRDIELLQDHLTGRNRVGVDEDGQIFVRDEGGDAAYGTTLDDLVKQTIADKPYLQKASDNMGAGSGPGDGKGTSVGFDLKTAAGRAAWVAANAPHIVPK
jgi:hypothetical protein